MILSIQRGDITAITTDAIVNAANPRMLGGGGVDGAIHRAAGPGLIVACRQIATVGQEEEKTVYTCTDPECSGWTGTEPLKVPMRGLGCPVCEGGPLEVVPQRTPRVAPTSPDTRCPTGEARITPGFNLPCKAVIHTVGPIYGHHEPDEAARLLASAYRESCALAVRCGLRSLTFPAISCGVYGFPMMEAARIALGALTETGWDLDEVRFVMFQEIPHAVWLQAAQDMGIELVDVTL